MTTHALARPGLLALALAIAGTDPVGAAELSFISQSNGGIVGIGSDIGCGTGLTETLESAFDGFSVRNGGYTPAVGEVWYAHVLISHPGNPCSGGNYNGVEILPPANTTFAISADYPVFCALYSPGQNLTTIYYRQNQGCPQAPTSGFEGYSFPAYNGAASQPWLIASYAYLELLIPLRSTAPLNGQNLRFRVNPDIGVVGYADVGVLVNGDVVFRDDMDGITLIPDLCTITSCNVAP